MNITGRSREERRAEFDAELGILSYRRRAVSLSGSFSARLRRIPRHRAISLGYSSWTLFLVFYVLERVLYCYFMVTTCTNCGKGVELRLLPVRFSAEDAESLRAGKPYGNDESDIHLDPARHYIYFWKLSSGGRIEVNDGEITAEESLDHLCSLSQGRAYYGGAILLEPQADATYQDFLSALEVARRRAPDPPWEQCAAIIPVSGSG